MEHREMLTPPDSEINPGKKRKYFQKLAMKYLPGMRLMLRGGRLSKAEGWRNVMEHCIAQVAAAESLCDLLKLDEKTKKRITVTAACHDWQKRLDTELAKDTINPEDRQEIMARSQRFIEEANPDETLLFATSENHFKKSIQEPEKVSLAEKIQDYLDNIHRGSEIVSFDERIEEVSTRNPNVGKTLEENNELGGLSFWEAVRQIGKAEEREIFELLRKQGVAVNTPEEIPQIIKAEIVRRINEIEII